MKFSLCVLGASQVVQVVNNGEKKVTGKNMADIAILQAENGLGVGVLVDEQGNISHIGKDEELLEITKEHNVSEYINANGCCILPGFVDGHTHSVWLGDRVHEFAMKLAGATYMEVHAAGGGINFTVEHVRQASKQELFDQLKHYLRRMIQAGTTLVEVKSGYGMNKETEIKMLEVIEMARKDNEITVDISTTYCGAHSVPKGMTSEEATKDILENQIPQISAMMKAGELHVDNIDVFCEQGVYNVDQTERILRAGVASGMAINFHGEELHRLNSAEMGAQLGARAISHLEEVSDEGMAAMAKAGVCATVLPTTAYILRLQPPPVRKMIDAGVPVALGSDFNPNAHCISMPLVMHLACVTMKMSMNEALIAATLNAAASLGKSGTHGSIEVGKVADMIIVESPRWEHIIYQLGGSHHIIKHVIKKGKIVHTRS